MSGYTPPLSIHPLIPLQYKHLNTPSQLNISHTTDQHTPIMHSYILSIGTPSQFTLTTHHINTITLYGLTLLTHLIINRDVESGLCSTMVNECGNHQHQHRSCRYVLPYPITALCPHTLFKYLVNMPYQYVLSTQHIFSTHVLSTHVISTHPINTQSSAGTAGTTKIDPSKGVAKIDLSTWSVSVHTIPMLSLIHEHTL